jgi:hypothetical protein
VVKIAFSGKAGFAAKMVQKSIFVHIPTAGYFPQFPNNRLEWQPAVIRQGCSGGGQAVFSAGFAVSCKESLYGRDQGNCVSANVSRG